MRVCTMCGKESREDETVCAQCGQQLPASATATAQVAATAPTGWVWPWQRADHSEPLPTPKAGGGALVNGDATADNGDTAPASTAVDLAAREHLNGSAPRSSPLPAAAGRLILEVTESGEPPSEFALDGRNVTIGRAPACTVSLPEDQLASRLHAMLHFTGDEYTISDLGSSNGTLVNGTLLRGATPLAEGDRITVGQHVLIYTRSVGAHAVAPADAQNQSAVPAFVSAAAMAQTSELAPADAPFDNATPDASTLATATNPIAWSPPDAESDPVALPTDAPVAPSWPPAGTDPWVMPAPPQWAAGPGVDTWSAPQEPEPAPTAAAEETADRADEDPSQWVTPTAAWGQEASAEAVAPPTWLAAAVSHAPRELETYAAAPPVSASAALDMDQGPATGELAQVRSQLMQSSELLARWTQSAASHSRQVRTELAALAYEIANTLAETPGAGGQGDAALEELVQLAENAAQDPHHVNTVVALATRSREVAEALKTQRQLLTALKRVGDRLSELARRDSW